ncbi:MAG TPA: DNA polymerase I [Hyphomonadaceae bacterium]|nr:DNA polymerase I [Hyphomonadaceae bacterium]
MPAHRPLNAQSRVYLIDGSGYVFRAYHALPPLTRARDGAPVNAVHGFCQMLFKLLEDMKAGERPTHLAVILDAGAKTFRNDLYPAYKAHRPPAPEDLAPQFPMIREATRAFGVPAIELAGYEADDLIATYTRQARAAGAEVVILSSDKDLMQLVGEGVSLFDGMKNKRLGREAVIEKFGAGPERVIDIQALSGDSADNIPGAPGIGPKTAVVLLDEFGSLEALLARAHEIKQPKRREAIEANKDAILLSRQLVTLKADVPVTAALEEFGATDPDPQVLAPYLDDMEFRALAKRVRAALGEAGPAAGADPDSQRSIDRGRYETVTDLPRLEAWIARAFAAGTMAVDTETDALSATHARLVGISLAIGPNEACYIPLGHRSPAADLLSEAAPPPLQLALDAAIAALKPLLEAPSVLKIGQNIKYDIAVLARYGLRVAPYDDTMLMSFVLDAGRGGHGMDELSLRYLGHAPIPFAQLCGSGKSQITFDRVPIDQATAYAAEDADVTLRLYHILAARLQADGIRRVYARIERAMPAIIADMELAGILVDRDELSRLSGRFAQKMAALEAKAYSLAGRAFNLASPKQLGELLFDDMGLPGGKRTATGAWSTDADMLEGLAAQGHELPQVILDWRMLAKLKGTYADALREAADPETGRVHTSFSLTGANTGRLASSDPNVQNIPVRTEEGRMIREAFIAPPGSVLISADYSQIELRLLAHIADIGALKDAFRRGQDIHAMTASEMFGVPIEGMDPLIRRKAKAINFGIIYGISGYGLANQLGIEPREAQDYIHRYFERFPGIKDYMERTKAFARDKGYVETAFGRRVHVRDIAAKTQQQRQFGERQAINAPIQGSAADVIKRAMARLPNALVEAGLRARMLLQVHDELIFEAPEAEADATAALARRVMEQAPLPAIALSVPLTVEARAAKSWAQAH